VAVPAFGLVLGALARSAGMTPLEIAVMSATTFAGSAQFAAVGLLAGGSVAAAVTAAILLNARYLPMGIASAPAIRGPWWRRLLLGQLVVDESWAVANRGDGTFDGRRLIGAGALLYATWVASTALGALAGDLLGDPRRLGMDAAFPALFLALAWPYLRERRSILAALLGAGIALAATPLAPAGVPIVLASVAALIGLRR
jgi:4-azaleucine resistance transporter AzlC